MNLNLYEDHFSYVNDITNKKKKCLIYDGFRVDRILKNNDISWRCTNNKSKCKARVRTDGESKVVMSAMSEHNHDMNERKIESKQLRVTSILVKTLCHFNSNLLIL
jgi:hypothetical protein